MISDLRAINQAMRHSANAIVVAILLTSSMDRSPFNRFTAGLLGEANSDPLEFITELLSESY